MIINEVEYSDKLIRRWKQLSANFEFALREGWIPIVSDLAIEFELIEVGHPNFEGKEVKYVKCSVCGDQYKIVSATSSIYYIKRHKDMGCKNKDS